MKVTGSEIKDFWINYWPTNLSDWYYGDGEEEGICIDDEKGNFILELDKKYSTRSFAGLYWQGKYNENPLNTGNGYMTFEKAFKQYKLINDGKIILTISIDESYLEDFKSIADANGIKII